MTLTPYYDDFRAYYEKAAVLQARNHWAGREQSCGDPLMDTVTIYDTIHRRYAGFSNVLEDLHHREPVQAVQDLPTALWLYGVHRMTGSGASFLPRSAGARRHGYCNSVVKELAELTYVEEMVAQLKLWDESFVKLFTSIGNQPPPFPDKRPGYRLAGVSYFCEVWPGVVLEMCDWLQECRKRYRTIGARITEATEHLLTLNRAAGCKQFKFTLTAVAMDLAEYWPDLVDQCSMCGLGANAELALDAMFDEVPRRHSRAWREEALTQLCAPLLANPYDVEDVLCDVVRYWLNYVPRTGYEAYSDAELKNNSAVQVADFQRYIQARG